MNKKAFSLLELIFVVFISSIVLIYTFKFTKELYETSTENEKVAVLKIDMNSTKIFIQKNLSSYSKLKYRDKILFYDDNILLTDVTSFEIKKYSNILEIQITIDNTISQIWKYKIL